MSIKTLFSIILKVLGIFFIKDILAAIPQVLTTIVYITIADSVSEAFLTSIGSVLVLGMYVWVTYTLVLRTEWVIAKLKLAEGFDEEDIQLNMHRSTMLSICIIVIGGLMVANEIPNICSYLYAYWQEKNITLGATNPDISFTIWAVVRLIIGLLLMGQQRQIVNYIERRRV